jgi:hypothetical protein
MAQRELLPAAGPANARPANRGPCLPAQVYCLDVQFVFEMPKFIAGCMTALSAMVQLELPHVNVLTKMDLCKDKASTEKGQAGSGGAWAGPSSGLMQLLLSVGRARLHACVIAQLPRPGWSSLANSARRMDFVPPLSLLAEGG